MKYLLALLLVGCATEAYWYVDMPDYAPERIVYERLNSQHETDTRCASGVKVAGCAIRMTETCLIILGPKADACTESHEERHCKGWNHRTGVHYSTDCGA